MIVALRGVFERNRPIVGSERTKSRVKTIYAAIKAKDEEEAWKIVEDSYAERPVVLVRRFCNGRKEGWSPFNERFPKADWMTWK